MADINMSLKLLTNLKDATTDAKELNKELEKAAKLASSIKIGSGSTQETTTRSASQTRAVSSASGSNKRSAMDDSGLSRGTAGGNVRGDSRDFARQAQGLGGLVHVYATFAANLFAVSAAFNALSKAADVTNMVEGLNQLGAASGKNLGTLAKKMAEISDGAINMKESMSAVAQGSAAGLTGQQMQRMTQIAKTASQALGRDMGDALSRLSRGITKIEPELLDELGIMVKVDKAARDYALSLGKTSSQLTEFEKRQSFAIAVLEQGEKKFGSINIEANPYQKLLASFTNLAIKGGELLNTVLGPIAKILSESPVALSAVMAGIATMLLTKAIPALSQWREGVSKAADEAERRSSEIASKLANFKSSKAGAEARQIDEETKALRTKAQALILENKLLGEKTKSFSEIAGSSNTLKTATAEVEKKLNGVQKAIVAQTSAMKTLSGEELAGAKKSLENLELRKQKLKELDTYIKSIITSTKAADAAQAKGETVGWEDRERQKIANNAALKAATLRIGADISENIKTKGISAAWDQIGKDIDKYNDKVKKAGENGGTQISGLNKALIYTGGAAKIAVAGVELLGSALNKAFFYIGIFITAYEILDSLFSKNTKEAQKFSTSLDTLNSSVDSASKTLDLISKKDPLEKLSPETIQAKANAINELSDSLSETIRAFNNLQKVNSGWDSFWDSFILSIVGRDSKTKLIKALSETMSSAFSLAKNNNSVLQEASNSVKDIFGKDVALNAKELEKALKSVAPKEFETKLLAVEKVISKINLEMGNSNSKLQTLNNSFSSAIREYDTLVTSLNPSDSFGKLGVAIMKVATDMSTAFEDTTIALTSLIETSKDFNKLKLLDPSVAQQLVKDSKELEEIAQNISAYQTAAANIENDLNNLSKNKSSPKKSILGKGTTGFDTDNSTREEVVKRALLNEINAGLDKYNSQASKFISDYSQSMQSTYQRGAEYLYKSLESAFANGAILIKKGILANVEGPLAEKLKSEANIEQLNIERKQIEQSVQLLVSQHELKLAIDQNTIEQKISRLETKKKEMGEDKFNASSYKTDLDLTQKAYTRNKEARETLESKVGDKTSLKDLSKVLKDAKDLRAEFSGLIAATIGAESKLAELSAKVVSEQISKRINVSKAEFKQAQDALSVDKERINLEQQRLDTKQKLLGVAGISLESERINLELQSRNNNLATIYLKEQEEVVKSKILEESINKNIKDSRQRNDALEAVRISRDARVSAAKIEANKVIETSEQKIQDIISDTIKLQEEYYISRKTRTIEYQKLNNEINISNLDFMEQELEFQNKLIGFDAITYASIKQEIALKKQAASYSEKLAQEELEYIKKSSGLKQEALRIEIKLKQIASKSNITQADVEEMNQLDSVWSDIVDRINDANKSHTKTLELLDIQNKKIIKNISDTTDLAKADATWKPFATGIGDALKAGLEDGFTNGAKAGAQTLISTLKANLRKAVFQVILSPIMQGFQGVINAAFGSMGFGGAGITGGIGGLNSGISGLTGAVNNLSNLFNTSPLTDTWLKFTNSEIGQSWGLSNGAYDASGVVTPGANAGFADSVTSFTKAVDNYGGYVMAAYDFSKGNYGAAIGSAIGQSWGPVGATIGRMLGSMVDEMFGGGGGPKVEGSYKEGAIGSTWASGELNTQAKTYATSTGNVAKGVLRSAGIKTDLNSGAFISMDPNGTAQTQLNLVITDKTTGKELYNREKSYGTTENAGRTKEELQSAMEKTVNEALLAVILNSDSLPTASKALLTKFSDSFKDLSKEQSGALVNAFTGGWLEDLTVAMSTLPAVIGPTSTALQLIPPTLEQVAEAAQRFGSIISIRPIIEQMGENFFRVGTKIADQFGSDGEAVQAITGYYDLFYSSEEKKQKTLTDAQNTVDRVFGEMGDTFAQLGVSVPKTDQEFRAIVDALDLTDEADQKTFASLMKLAPAFKLVTSSAEEQAKAIKDVKLRTAELTGNYGQIVSITKENTTATRQKILAEIGSNTALKEATQQMWKAEDAANAVAQGLGSINVQASEVTDILLDVMYQKVSAADAGKKIGTLITDGIYRALGEQFANTLITTFMGSIITPIITGILAGTLTLEEATNRLQGGAENFATRISTLNSLIGSPAFQQGMASIGVAAQQMVDAAAKIKLPAPASRDTGPSAAEIAKQEEDRIKTAKDAIKNLVDEIDRLRFSAMEATGLSTIDKQKHELAKKIADFAKTLSDAGVDTIDAQANELTLALKYRDQAKSHLTAAAIEARRAEIKNSRRGGNMSADQIEAQLQQELYGWRFLLNSSEETIQQMKAAGVWARHSAGMIEDFTVAQQALYDAMNAQAANTKTKDIKQKIFELTHNEDEIRLKAIRDEAESYRQFYSDLGLLSPEIEAMIAQWEDLAKKGKSASTSLKEEQEKRFSMEMRIYELTNRSTLAKEKQRQKELAGLSDDLKPIQEYIYALEDLNDAYTAAKDRLTEVIDGINSSLDSLKEYKLSLKTGDKTTLTPMDRYNLLKQEYESTLLIAKSTPTDEKSRKAQQDAIAKLPSLGDSFLEASRTLYASSANYTVDFNSVLDGIAATEGSLRDQKDIAEEQLVRLQEAETRLGIINGNIVETNTLLERVEAAILQIDLTSTGAAAAGSEAAGGTPYTPPTTDANTTLVNSLYDRYLNRAPDAAGLNYWKGALDSGIYTSSTIEDAFKPAAYKELVSNLYSEILHRQAAEAEKSYWVGLLTSGALSMYSLRSAFIQAAQNELYPTSSAAAISSPAPSTSTAVIGPSTSTSVFGPSTSTAVIGPSTSVIGPTSSTSTTPYADEGSTIRRLTTPLRVTAYAEGGLAQGLSLVGEEGPELVNFSKPAMVYTAGQTMSTMSETNRELLNEIKSLREEVAKLREEQNKHTGNLIISNYDSANKVAQTLVDAVGDVSSEIAWAERSKVKVV